MLNKTVFYAVSAVALAACSGGGGSGSCSGETSGTVTISGNVSYDFVPHNFNGSLDYNNTESRDVRGATVTLLDGSNRTLATTSTDANGTYNFSSPTNTEVRVRVAAELAATGTPSWQVSVTDNTSNNALYVMQGELICSGTGNNSRDIHASSGWGISSYTNERTAAPFAILDSVYESIEMLLSSDPGLSLSEVELRWSTENVAAGGNTAEGFIGTSHYDGDNIFILGDADNDTDEYDRAVVQHEFAHYLEDTISRSDSIGGSHTLNSRTDMRVAFSEGFANAFTAMASGTGYYEDSLGSRQAQGFRFSVEDNNGSNFGWYSENSTQQIVYDIFDNTSDGADSLSLGFDAIYDVMTDPNYRQNQALTSIYLFADVLKSNLAVNEAAGVDDLMEDQQIFGDGPFGSGETNGAGLSIILPVYSSLSAGETINLCSNSSAGLYNGIDVRRFVRVTIASTGTYNLDAVKTSGGGTRDPDIWIYNRGELVQRFISSDPDEERGQVTLSAGEYVIEFYDFINANLESGSNAGLSCFDLSLN